MRLFQTVVMVSVGYKVGHGLMTPLTRWFWRREMSADFWVWENFYCNVQLLLKPKTLFVRREIIQESFVIFSSDCEVCFYLCTAFQRPPSKKKSSRNRSSSLPNSDIMASGPSLPHHPAPQGHLFSAIHFSGKSLFPSALLGP